MGLVLALTEIRTTNSGQSHLSTSHPGVGRSSNMAPHHICTNLSQMMCNRGAQGLVSAGNVIVVLAAIVKGLLPRITRMTFLDILQQIQFRS